MNTLLAFWAAQLAALGLVFFAVRHPNGGRKGLLLLLTALPFVLCMLWGGALQGHAGRDRSRPQLSSG